MAFLLLVLVPFTEPKGFFFSFFPCALSPGPTGRIPGFYLPFCFEFHSTCPTLHVGCCFLVLVVPLAPIGGSICPFFSHGFFLTWAFCRSWFFSTSFHAHTPPKLLLFFLLWGSCDSRPLFIGASPIFVTGSFLLFSYALSPKQRVQFFLTPFFFPFLSPSL